MSRAKPPLDLDVEVESPSGIFTLPCDAKQASKRPRNLTFGTQRGDGFGTASATLSREIFKDHVDIGLLDTWRMVSKTGKVAYEGRLHSAPRTNDPQEQIDVNLVGWMTYLKSKKITPLIIDRRLSGWGETSTQRRANLIAASVDPLAVQMSQTAAGEGGSDGAGITAQFQSLKSGREERGELMYYSGGANIGKVIWDLKGRSSEEDATFFNGIQLSSDGINTDGTYANSNTVTALHKELVNERAGIFPYAILITDYGGVAVIDPYVEAFRWQNLVVCGDQGLTLRGTWPEVGFYLTDIIQYLLATYYPKITWAGQENTFLVTQCTSHDNPAFGYDILQQLNNLVLWETNVWEDRKLHFEPADLTTYDWQFSTDDPGVSVVFQGDSIENFANGISVTYTDFAGVKHTIYPSDNSELRDESENNPATKHGEDLWTDVEVPWQCTEAEAIQFGRAYLAEYNRPKRPGTYTIAGGYIRDYAGNWHAGWGPRCSETVGIVNHPADEPRLITETSWNDESKTLSITVDAPSSMLEAIVGRMENARQARNVV